MDGAREEARRHIRRKRTFLTILAIYVVLSILWFAIDALTGTDDWWFYWPMLGAGLLVVLIGIAMFGVSGLFGAGWQRREEEKYLQRHGPVEDPGGEGSTEPPPPPPPP